MYIEFEMSIVSSGDGGIAAGATWVMFGKTLDGSDLELCTTNPDAYTIASGDISPDNVPWPVSFSSGNDILGRSNCQYYHDDNGPGSFSCDGVDEFACIQDDQHDTEFPCDDVGVADTYVPKVRCLFPV